MAIPTATRVAAADPRQACRRVLKNCAEIGGAGASPLKHAAKLPELLQRRMTADDLLESEEFRGPLLRRASCATSNVQSVREAFECIHTIARACIRDFEDVGRYLESRHYAIEVGREPPHERTFSKVNARACILLTVWQDNRDMVEIVTMLKETAAAEQRKDAA